MTRFNEGEYRTQATLLPGRLDGYVAESNPVRVIDVFVDELHLQSLGFKTEPEDTENPGQRAKYSNFSEFYSLIRF